MCSPDRTSLIGLATLAITSFGIACGGRWVEVPGTEGTLKSAAAVRAERRLYDGAPPVIPHTDFGADCSACHDSRGISLEGVGYAPASPHDATSSSSGTVRCRQCHVFRTTADLFVASEFVGLKQNLRVGGRLNPISPPTIPHQIFMRENCLACHSGPAAREEIRTAHPDRVRCRQCHLAVTIRSEFKSELGAGLTGSDSTQTEPD